MDGYVQDDRSKVNKGRLKDVTNVLEVFLERFKIILGYLSLMPLIANLN